MRCAALPNESLRDTSSAALFSGRLLVPLWHVLAIFAFHTGAQVGYTQAMSANRNSAERSAVDAKAKSVSCCVLL
jgi:stringent starvation protein B